MRITVPITGELRSDLSGKTDNPVRPVDISKLLPPELRGSGFKCNHYDFKNETVELEITHTRQSIILSTNPDGTPNETRPETDEEFNTRVAQTESEIEKLRGMESEELLQLTGDEKLVKTELKEI